MTRSVSARLQVEAGVVGVRVPIGERVAGGRIVVDIVEFHVVVIHHGNVVILMARSARPAGRRVVAVRRSICAERFRGIAGTWRT